MPRSPNVTASPGAPDLPDKVDTYVGQMIRVRRNVLGRSQSDLAKAIGVTFQQVQKYERAANRVSASMLVRIADHLGCSAGELLPGAGHEGPGMALAVELAALGGGVELAEAFTAMGPRRRRALLGVARALADLDEDQID